MGKIKIGSRDSLLALAQARAVQYAIEELRKGYEIELVTMKTSGDLILDRPLDREGGKGLFTRELDRALLEKRIDIAVHSLKDIPSTLPSGLHIGAFCAEEDPRDALVLPRGMAEITMNKPLGCAGKRRETQLAALFPGWRSALVRGNVPTRLEKLDRGDYGALVLAAAGLKRLGLADRIARIFEPDELLPPAGQGILACVVRDELSEDVAVILRHLDSPAARTRALCERAFVQTLDGGCGTPVGAFALLKGDSITLRGYYAPSSGGAESGKAGVRGSLCGGSDKGEELAKILAFRLLAEYNRGQGRNGRVTLAGAGPGDGGLLTLKAQSAVACADVIVYDKLVGKSVIAGFPLHAEKIFAGKEAGNHVMEQDAINELLAAKAAAGAHVVRLKGGDPYLFGRGGEEALYMQRAGIPFEVIPGVCSALAVPAYAGIPVTQRGVSAQAHIIAAHGSDDSKIDYRTLAQSSGTLIFLMGANTLASLCRSLIEAGLAPSTAAAVIERGTTAGQRTVTASLDTLASLAASLGISAPAVTVVGEVCVFSSRLDFMAAKPLAGIRIAVTRPRSRPSLLASLLAERGAEVLEIPAITITPLSSTPLLLEELSGTVAKKWFVFTSAHAVEIFFDKLREYKKDIRALSRSRFAACGAATALALEARGICADLVPGNFSAESLAQKLTEVCAKDETVVLPRSASASDVLPRSLEAAGIGFSDIPLYTTNAVLGYEDAVYRSLLMEDLHWAAFTSASTVEHFCGIFNKEFEGAGLRALCIGETTAQAARRRGLPVVVAKNATLEGMVEALVYSVQDNR